MAISFGRMKRTEASLEAEVVRWLADAEAADAAYDTESGVEARADEMPDWVADKRKRLEKIREAKAALEAKAQEPPPADGDGPGPSSGRTDSARPTASNVTSPIRIRASSRPATATSRVTTARSASVAMPR